MAFSCRSNDMVLFNVESGSLAHACTANSSQSQISIKHLWIHRAAQHQNQSLANCFQYRNRWKKKKKKKKKGAVMFLSLQKAKKKKSHSLQRSLNPSHNSVLPVSNFVCQFRTTTDPKNTSTGAILRKRGHVCHWPKAWHGFMPANAFTQSALAFMR